jgi:hypothetical protein
MMLPVAVFFFGLDLILPDAWLIERFSNLAVQVAGYFVLGVLLLLAVAALGFAIASYTNRRVDYSARILQAVSDRRRKSNSDRRSKDV